VAILLKNGMREEDGISVDVEWNLTTAKNESESKETEHPNSP